MNAHLNTRLKKLFAPVIVLILAALVTAGSAEAGDIEDHIIKTETGFYYTVQKGDTLWDLSERFSDTPWQWPDLWQYNPDLPNPHLIYPGQRIRIYNKTFHGEKESRLEPEKQEKEPDKDYFAFSSINSVGFIREKAAEPSGTLFQSMGDKWFLSQDDRVYIRPEPGSDLSVGDTFFLHRTISPVRHPESNRRMGVQHLLTGIVEITDIKENLAIGNIMASFREILEGDKLIPFMVREQKLELKPGVSDIEARIIKSEDDWRAMGEHIIAFIDKGSDHGIEIGQQYQVLYPVMEKPGARSTEARELEREEMGSVIVLHTEDKASTVLITESKQDLSRGMPVTAMH
ncbi:MAG: LysM peptidoglycan-binding domain-containing protein [Desulfosalsimonas sp.]